MRSSCIAAVVLFLALPAAAAPRYDGSNRFVSPREVLSVAEQLDLTDEQLTTLTDLTRQMLKDASRITRQLAEKERALDELFNNRTVDEKAMRGYAMEIARLQGELRIVHLKSRIDTLRLLQPEQLDRFYDIQKDRAHGSRPAPHQISPHQGDPHQMHPHQMNPHQMEHHPIQPIHPGHGTDGEERMPGGGEK